MEKEEAHEDEALWKHAMGFGTCVCVDRRLFGPGRNQQIF